MLLRLGTQSRIVFFNLVANASIFGVVLTQKVTPLLLLVVPPLSATLGFAWLDHQRMLALIGQFVRVTMWKYFEGKTREVLPSWEDHWYQANPSLRIQVMNSVHPVAVFAGPAVVALILSISTAWSTHLIGVWAFDAALSLPIGVLAWWLTVVDIRPRWSALPPVEVRLYPAGLWRLGRRLCSRLLRRAHATTGSQR
jgi:hypothetical protein